MWMAHSRAGKLPLMAIIAAVLVLVLAAGGFAFMKMKKGSKAGGKKEKVELVEWKLDEFMVNLADRNDARYLKVNLVLDVEMKGKKKKGGGHGEEEANPEEAKARDAIIAVLTTKRYADLLSDEGKSKLKEQLKTALNEVLEECKVEEIYFTYFAMQ
jgi:flagellar protein FliL